MDANNNIQSIPSLPRTCKFDVFISFRGSDTRNGFVDHLYNNLIGKGIFAFKDDERLEKGEPISSELVQAIRDSRISIVVFSKNYADSRWCLDEMAVIAECKEELKQKVFPVFYDMDPSDVRNQKGWYHHAFALHEKFKLEDPDRVARWKSAMKELGNLGGWDLRNKTEFHEIADIVQKVIKELHHKFSGLANNLIGMQSRVQVLENLLRLNSDYNDFRVLGIWGMGGIGKTTHATVLYDRISFQFDAHCFIEDVSKIYKEGGAMAVQKQILRQTLKEQNLDTYSSSELSGIVTSRLYNRKVLVVLDNVDHLRQLEELKINPKLLSAGSRMIITTRDKHILEVYGADEVHNVPLLSNDDARELFLRKAFKRFYWSKSFDELIPEVLKYAQCLPLAIKVLGSFLSCRDDTQWRDALYRLGRNADNEIMAVLQLSYDGLRDTEKDIFLHIACFFNGERKDYVKRILDCCELYPHIGIAVLIEKSLITIKNEEIHMHQLLQELGKSIVREQFPQKPGLWSRLWLYQDFHDLMMSQMGTNNVEAIVLDQKGDVFKYNMLEAEEFSRMKSLKLLILHHKNFSGNLNFLSNSLHYLMWHGYPFTSLPLNFQPCRLVELNMPNSNMKRLWGGIKLPSLKRMDLSNSKYLEETPNFEGMSNLVQLDLGGCRNLSLVHSSIGFLRILAFLSLRDCSSLVSLHFGTKCKLGCLIVLNLSGCTKLENTPDFTGLSSLEHLDLERCSSLTTVHKSIGTLERLDFLSLRSCTNLVKISIMACMMMHLTTLDLSHCSKLIHFPIRHSSPFAFLIYMDLSFCNLRILPDAVGNLVSLERLNLQGSKLVSLPKTFVNLVKLTYLNLAHCHQLHYLSEFPILTDSWGEVIIKEYLDLVITDQGCIFVTAPSSHMAQLFIGMSWPLHGYLD